MSYYKVLFGVVVALPIFTSSLAAQFGFSLDSAQRAVEQSRRDAERAIQQPKESDRPQRSISESGGIMPTRPFSQQGERK